MVVWGFRHPCRVRRAFLSSTVLVASRQSGDRGRHGLGRVATRLILRTLVAALAVAGISLSGADAWAGCSGTTCIVDTTEDTLAGAQTSLRDAMTYANSNPGTSITFSLPANSTIIAGSAANGPLPAINADTIINGAGVAGLTISGSNTADNVQNRVFFVLSGTVAISDLAIADGKATGGAGGNGGQSGGGGGGMGAGGAIYAATTSAVTISNVSFSGNQATGGAGGVAIGCCEFAGDRKSVV